MSDETTLLPCPWCGEYPKIAEDGGSTGPWFCVWHDCPPVEGGKARHYGESLGCISITTAWFHAKTEAIAAWNTRMHGTLTAEQVEKAIRDCSTYASYDGCTYYASGIRLQAIADELNAELGSGTCSIKSSHLNDFTSNHECWYEFEMQCGYKFTWDEMEPPNFCPNCGKRVSA